MPEIGLTAEAESQATPRLVCVLAGSVLRLVQAIVAVPVLVYLLALSTMVFSHPDVPFHQVNRVTFGLLVVSVVGRAIILRQPVFLVERASWPMMALLLLVLISMLGRHVDDEAWGVLAAKYLFPFAMFHLAAMVFTVESDFRRFEVLTACVLAYLSFTAFVFLAGFRGLVFPQFILDPSLGHHADRARGPFLQAVANGVSLNLLGLLVLHAYRRGSLRGLKMLVLLGSLPVAILATMTRAVWLSFAGSAIVLLVLSKNIKLRLACIVAGFVTIAGLGVILSATDFGGTLGDRAEESGPVDYRKAVYAGGWEMFLERPLTGWGFHQMPSELPRYVSEYRDSKVLYPHNTYLEVLVENGLLGLALYAWLMWEMLRLGRGRIPDRERKGFLNSDFHKLWPILLAVYWVNAAVVVMSYPFVNGILFTLAGMLAAQRRRAEIASC